MVCWVHTAGGGTRTRAPGTRIGGAQRDAQAAVDVRATTFGIGQRQTRSRGGNVGRLVGRIGDSTSTVARAGFHSSIYLRPTGRLVQTGSVGLERPGRGRGWKQSDHDRDHTQAWRPLHTWHAASGRLTLRQSAPTIVSQAANSPHSPRPQGGSLGMPLVTPGGFVATSLTQERSESPACQCTAGSCAQSLVTDTSGQLRLLWSSQCPSVVWLRSVIALGTSIKEAKSGLAE